MATGTGARRCQRRVRRRLEYAPRAHPGDGRFDTLETSTMGLGDRWQARSRLAGTHVPHPAITTRRVEAIQYDFERPMPIGSTGVRSVRPATSVSGSNQTRSTSGSETIHSANR